MPGPILEAANAHLYSQHWEAEKGRVLGLLTIHSNLLSEIQVRERLCLNNQAVLVL